MNGKGSKPRPVKLSAFLDNWAKIKWSKKGGFIYQRLKLMEERERKHVRKLRRTRVSNSHN